MSRYKKSSNLGQYGLDIKKYKLLDLDTEKSLCSDIAKGSIKSRNELVTSNLNLVLKLAFKYQNMGLSIDDLICEGNKGLIIAANKFDASLNNRFTTYAYFWIKQSMLAAIDESKKWSSLSNNNVLNYDDYKDKDLTVNMHEFESNDGPNNIKDIIRKIDGLPKRDSSIVKHYFGISGFSEMNTVELSEKYNITTMRVSSIIENSIRKIRCEMLESQ